MGPLGRCRRVAIRGVIMGNVNVMYTVQYARMQQLASGALDVEGLLGAFSPWRYCSDDVYVDDFTIH